MPMVGVLKLGGEGGIENLTVTGIYKKLWILNLYDNPSRA